MPNIAPWQMIPTALLAMDKRKEKARAWGQAQRAVVAKQWGDAQREKMKGLVAQVYGNFERYAQPAIQQRAAADRLRTPLTPTQMGAQGVGAPITPETLARGGPAAPGLMGRREAPPGPFAAGLERAAPVAAAAGDILGRGQQAVFGAAAPIVDESRRRGLLGGVGSQITPGAVVAGAKAGLTGQQSMGFESLLERAGVGPSLGRTAAGVAGDIVIDPVGILPVGKAAGLVGKGARALAPAAKGLMKADRAMGAIASGGRRMFHGTGSAFDVPDAAKFDANGLFGPGYYLTSDPRVASSYATTRAGQVGLSNLNMSDEVVGELPGIRSNVRAVDVPAGLNLLDADAELTPAILQRVEDGLVKAMGDDPYVAYVRGLARDAEEYPNLARTRTLSDIRQQARPGNQPPLDWETMNRGLMNAGFDGIRYNGGKRIPMRDEAGKAIEHDAVVIFPEAMPKLRNAISGTAGGIMPRRGAALRDMVPMVGPMAAGGVVGATAQPDDATLGQRVLGGAAGAVLGASLPGAGTLVGGRLGVRKGLHPASEAVAKMYAGKGPMRGPGLSERIGTIWRGVTYEMTDRLIDLKKFQERAAKVAGRPLNADEMAYELARLNPDKAAEVKLQEGLRPALLAVGGDRDLLEIMLTHFDNIDVAKAMNNPDRAFSANLTAAESAAALADFQKTIDPKTMKTLWQSAGQVWDFGRSLLQRKLDAGLIDQGLYNDLTTKYPHYVPTRILDYIKDPARIPVGKSLSISDPGLRRNTVEGTTRERENPLASIVRLAYETEALARKNEAANAVIKLRGLDPSLQASIRQVPLSYTKTRTEDAISVFEGGVHKKYAMPVDLATAVRQEPGVMIPGIGILTGLFRSLVTARNPLFLGPNAVTDAISMIARTTSEEGGGFWRTPGIALDLFKAYGDAFKGLMSGTYTGKGTASYLKGGGGMAGLFDASPARAQQTVRDLARPRVFSVDSLDDLKRIAGDLVTLRPIEGVGERIELAPRVAAANRAKRRGANTVEATIAGRNVTIDFAQGGRTAKILNQFIPFFNVGMQAVATPGRIIRKNPKGALAVVTYLGGAIAAAEAWNNADPQRAKDYADVPDYVKDQGLVIMLPVEAPVDSRGERRPQLVLLRTREFSPVVIAMREAARRVLGEDPRAIGDILGGAAEAISPVGASSASDVFTSFMPPGLAQGAEIALDKDFYRGNYIATERNDEQASAISKGIAPTIGARPSQVEHVIRGIGGGPARLALEAGDRIAGTRPAAQTPQEIPFAGSAIGRIVRGDIGGRLNKAQEAGLPAEAQAALREAGIDYRPQPVRSTILYEGTTYKLTRAQQEQYQVAADRYTAEAIAALVTDPDWPAADVERKDKAVRYAAEEARKKAKFEMLHEILDTKKAS